MPAIVIFGAAVPQQSMACDRLTISLKEQATVSTAEVLLGDVADIYCADQGRLEQLISLPVAAAPLPGVVLSLDGGLIHQKVNAILKNSTGFTISGAPVVRITVRGRIVEPAELVPLVKAFLLETTPWRESEIEIRSIGNVSGVEIPLGDYSLRIPKKSHLSGARETLFPFEILVKEHPYRIFWASVDVRVRAEILRAARKIPYGKIIAREDVEGALVEIQDARVACLRQPEDAVGLVSRRTLLPGDPLTRESVTNPLLIRAGDTVRLRLERNGIHVATFARAEQDGKLGQFIRIRNLDFSRPVKAEVVGLREVRIE